MHPAKIKIKKKSKARKTLLLSVLSCTKSSEAVAVAQSSDADLCLHRMVSKTDCGWHRTRGKFKHFSEVKFLLS